MKNLFTRNSASVSFSVRSLYEGHQKVTYRGVKMLKDPFDYLIYQMIICEIIPDLIIEIGTNIGGGALYLADLLEMVDHGIVHTIDIKDQADPIISGHKRIVRFTDGWENYDSKQAKNFEKVMVIEDSSHMYGNTLRVLEEFSDIVTVGSYFIVEDGIIKHLGFDKLYQGGPLRAINEFLQKNKNYEIDKKWCNLFGNNATFNVNGYLRKVSKENFDEFNR